MRLLNILLLSALVYTSSCSSFDEVPEPGVKSSTYDSIILTNDTIWAPTYTIFIPNTLTPDGDGLNDYFLIATNYISDEDFEVKIFDNNNKVVFTSISKNFRWDGTYEGNDLPTGYFTFTLKYKASISGETGTYTGRLLLLR